VVPLFSLWSSQGWGVGEIGDIALMARWLEAAGLRILQLLPIHEMPPAETSPYSALSAMAIDPLFISLAEVEDFLAAGGEQGLDEESRLRLAEARARMEAKHRVDYRTVRDLKGRALRRAFAHFQRNEWAGRTNRASAFREYVAEQRWWLEDYALFRALHFRFDERPWTEWPAPVRDRVPEALDQARWELAEDVLFRQYLQWVADRQWRDARKQMGRIALFGDLPFMVAGDSADVWARQDQFRLDASAGAPPDAFSATGQDWKLPVYRWDVIAGGDFEWLRDRARRYAALYDGYRVDHLVGFYRTYFRPHDGGPPQFTPAEEADQTALGERVLGILRETGSEITAEDLGVVPDFVRASLVRLGVPGYKVLRWERMWHADGQPFIDPVEYPASTVATSGTHDTEPTSVWWETAAAEERDAVLAIPSIRRALAGADGARTPSEDAVREALLSSLYASGSEILILPIQDIFGWRDRINVPGTVNDDNWTWALPWPVDLAGRVPAATTAADRLSELARRFGR
jgi:4-alpha-glucanotransferase